MSRNEDSSIGTSATAAPVAGAADQFAVPQQHVVQADWYWRHHHWHHRRWWHGGWHYWD
jgi:hypothetical protein